MAALRYCPFDKQVTKLHDCVIALREHKSVSSLIEDGIRIRMFQSKLLCDNRICMHNRHGEVGPKEEISFCSKETP